MARRPDVPAEPPTPDSTDPPPAADLGTHLGSYRVPGGHWDELLDDRRALRPHWQSFAREAGDLSPEHLSRAEARVARQIHENGVTYNVYAATDGASRPWELDALPMIIPAAEWERLAAGLRQRAVLLNAVAADFYGEQRLVSRGLVPPALVFAAPGFQRPCHGVSPAGGVFVHLAAFDLARGADGEWRVVKTRCQAPSGAGYALENRLIVARLFPDAFRALRTQMLTRFFERLREMLHDGAPCGGEAPHVVLLTPGPYSETYFEHAYLARHLGFTLVEGGDLTVRDDRVYLKTLEGLDRVHVILRRLDDDFCDPLELRADSTLGVPGMTQAWRAGHVLVANAFGTGVLESSALLAFLPGIAEHVLGEPLAVRSAATWWCGEAAGKPDAFPGFDGMVIKPAFPDARAKPTFADELGESARADWRRRLLASPDRYVLQEYLPLSHAPVWRGSRLESRALMLRVFLAADGRGDYHVMPGALARVAGGDHHVVSGPRGGSSKDTWALSEAPIDFVSVLPARLHLEDTARRPHAVSSRAAEHLFWLGRYAERSENCARLLRSVLSRLLDREVFPAPLLRVVTRACRRQGLLGATAEETSMAPLRLERELIDAMFDRRRGASLAFNIEQTVRVAANVRARLSTDTGRLLNQIPQGFAQPPRSAIRLAETLELIDRTIVRLAAVGGLETERTIRDEGWRFLSIGRCLERLLFVTATAAEVVASEDAAEPSLLEWLLDLSDHTLIYRVRHTHQPEWAPTVDLLLFDRHNPRALAYQLGKLAKHARLLPASGLAELVREVQLMRASCRMPAGPDGGLSGAPGRLDDLLRGCEDLALRLSDAITLRYFSHVYEPARATAVL
ncbi:MAG TPA: circularly permuted type 2 ATP-grasp protein [Candidatus Methylomirabilis sp.]|nr:circularly permuted type 2 ATP-grasp protein [Candidatus Methylomirabilis sp.]